MAHMIVFHVLLWEHQVPGHTQLMHFDGPSFHEADKSSTPSESNVKPQVAT